MKKILVVIFTLISLTHAQHGINQRADHTISPDLSWGVDLYGNLTFNGSLAYNYKDFSLGIKGTGNDLFMSAYGFVSYRYRRLGFSLGLGSASTLPARNENYYSAFYGVKFYSFKYFYVNAEHHLFKNPTNSFDDVFVGIGFTSDLRIIEYLFALINPDRSYLFKYD